MTGAPRDDRELAAGFLRGDEAAFRELYRRYTPRLYAVARRLGGSRPDAEDVVQETWLRAARRLAGFRWESSLPTWLTGIALNVTRERYRRADEAVPSEREPVAPAAAPEGCLDLERGLLALAEGYREVLLLHDVWGLTHEEVGAVLGIDAGTSKSQLSRARRALRDRLSAPADKGRM